jgi:hypothetical protein
MNVSIRRMLEAGRLPVQTANLAGEQHHISFPLWRADVVDEYEYMDNENLYVQESASKVASPVDSVWTEGQRSDPGMDAALLCHELDGREVLTLQGHKGIELITIARLPGDAERAEEQGRVMTTRPTAAPLLTARTAWGIRPMSRN